MAGRALDPRQPEYQAPRPAVERGDKNGDRCCRQARWKRPEIAFSPVAEHLERVRGARRLADRGLREEGIGSSDLQRERCMGPATLDHSRTRLSPSEGPSRRSFSAAKSGAASAQRRRAMVERHAGLRERTRQPRPEQNHGCPASGRAGQRDDRKVRSPFEVLHLEREPHAGPPADRRVQPIRSSPRRNSPPRRPGGVG